MISHDMPVISGYRIVSEISVIAYWIPFFVGLSKLKILSEKLDSVWPFIPLVMIFGKAKGRICHFLQGI
jgi:hypothetical protein